MKQGKFFAVGMLAVMFIMNACGGRAAPAELFKYRVEDGGVKIVDYTGTSRELVIPGKINGRPVTAIGDSFLQNTTSPVSVSIPNSVTAIGRAAFFNSGLQSVKLPKNLKTIDKDAFGNCVYLNDKSRVAIKAAIAKARKQE
jgi:hypothetical protein